MSDEPNTNAEAANPEATPVDASTSPPVSIEQIESPPPAAAPKPTRKKTNVINPYVWGTGRRKSAVARVRIRAGEGKYVINKREIDAYFRLEKDQQSVTRPLDVTETKTALDVFVNVVGGGVSGQAGAVLLGLARALAKLDPDYEPKLREHKLLRRDPRRVERKKYGQRGARRRFQFSKR